MPENLLELHAKAQQLSWQQVPEQALTLWPQAEELSKQARDLLTTLPPLYWSPAKDEFWLVAPSTLVDKTASDCREALQTLRPTHVSPQRPSLVAEDDDWIKLAEDPIPPYSPNLRRIGETMQLLPSSGTIPSYPSPLTSMLVGGLIGGAGGQGLGWLTEKALPRRWQRGRLRRTLGMLGAGMGAAPGALWGLGNLANGHGPLSNWPHGTSETPEAKQAFDEMDMTGWSGPSVPVNEFNQVLWTDPRVSERVSFPTRAAATGLLQGAAHLAGGSFPSRLITPLDIGRMAVGMGSGYASGVLVGKALGYLMGMPESMQNRLKTTGMWAGVINTMIPKAFGQ